MQKFLPILAFALVLALSSCAAPAAESSATPSPSPEPTFSTTKVSEDYQAPSDVVVQLKGRLRTDEDRSWHDQSIVVHPGDEVELQLAYANYSPTNHTSVSVGFNLDSELVYQSETFTLYSSELEGPLRFKGDITDVPIGDYAGTAEAESGAPGGYAYCRIIVTVPTDTKHDLSTEVVVVCESEDDTVHIATDLFDLKVE